MDNRSPLMKKLAEIMPKSAAEKATDLTFPMRIELHPIRQSADAFASWMGDELPTDRRELVSMLWVFGEILYGNMEGMLNESIRRQNDLLVTLPIKSSIFEKIESKMKDFDNACAAGNLKEMERLAPKGPTYGKFVRPRTKAEEERIINAVNRVRMEIEDVAYGT